MKKTTRRSTLVGKTCRVAGFGFIPHPEKNWWWINIVVYRVGAGYLFTLGEHADSPNRDRLRKSLGKCVPGVVVAPYAVRALEGDISFEELKQHCEESWPGAGFEWSAIGGNSVSP